MKELFCTIGKRSANSEQTGPLTANWNTNFFYPFRNKRSSFNSSDFPSCSFRSDLGTSRCNFSLGIVRNTLFLFTGISIAFGNVLFPFGSNCSFSCPTGTELSLIKVFFFFQDECYIPRINGDRFRIC